MKLKINSRSRTVIGLTALLLLAALVALWGTLPKHAGQLPEVAVLNLYVWEDSIPLDVIKDFEKESGVVVKAEYYGSLDDLDQRVRQDKTRFDLIAPSDYLVESLSRDHLLLDLPLEAGKLRDRLQDRFRNPWYDPGLGHCLPFQCSLTGLAYNQDHVKNPPRRWADLLDPARAKEWSGRISLLNDPRETMAVALLADGVSPDTKDPAAWERAGARIRAILPHVAGFDGETFENGLERGSIWIAQGYNGDLARAQASNPAIRYVIPEEGALTSIDNLAIPSGARHVGSAVKLMEFLLRPGTIRRITEAQGFSGTLREKAKVEISLPFDPDTVFGLPPPEKIYMLHPSQAEEATVRKLWKQFGDF